MIYCPKCGTIALIIWVHERHPMTGQATCIRCNTEFDITLTERTKNGTSKSNTGSDLSVGN